MLEHHLCRFRFVILCSDRQHWRVGYLESG